MPFIGKAHKYGTNVDTDALIPARYLKFSEPAELAKHCLEDLDPDFLNRVRPGDIIVAGTNFGCGSSREHAPIALKAAGIACVIARSFARIFFRNAINIGLPVLESEEAVAGCEMGDTLEVNLEVGEIKNLTRGISFQAKPYPPFMTELLAAGGLVEYTRRRLAARR